MDNAVMGYISPLPDKPYRLLLLQVNSIEIMERMAIESRQLFS